MTEDSALDLVLEDVARAIAVLADRRLHTLAPDRQTALDSALRANTGAVELSIRIAPTPRIIAFAKLGSGPRVFVGLGQWERGPDGLWEPIPVTVEVPPAAAVPARVN